MRVKLLFVLALLLAAGCDKERGEDYNESQIYLRDASGQCLILERSISVFGSAYTQSGQLQVRRLPEGNPCIAPEVKK